MSRTTRNLQRLRRQGSPIPAPAASSTAIPLVVTQSVAGGHIHPVLPNSEMHSLLSNPAVREFLEQYPEMAKAYWDSVTKCFVTFVEKNNDYGLNNIEMGEKSLTLLGVAIRARDKVQRLLNLLFKKKDPLNEKKADSWLDLANYGIIGMIYSDDKWGK